MMMKDWKNQIHDHYEDLSQQNVKKNVAVSMSKNQKQQEQSTYFCENDSAEEWRHRCSTMSTCHKCVSQYVQLTSKMMIFPLD